MVEKAPPTRDEMREMLVALLNGTKSRESVADWASECGSVSVVTCMQAVAEPIQKRRAVCVNMLPPE
jgi:hypothetical protein